jgi:predicted PurR-regulated permease PerM
MPTAAPPTESVRSQLTAQTVGVRVVAGLLIVGAMYLLATIMVPFVMALVLAIAFSPLANRLERAGLPRALASLTCIMLVVAVLAAAGGLILYQSGAMLQTSDKALERVAELLGEVARATGADRLIQETGPAGSQEGPNASPDGDAPSSAPGPDWVNIVRNHVNTLARWVISGLGGALGFLGGVVIFLAFLYYMLANRSEWIERIERASDALGLHPLSGELSKIQGEIVTYISYLAMVSLVYMVVISLAAWAIGLPQPVLWGILTALLEVIPYFGPLIAGALPTVVSLTTGAGMWQPLTVIGLFVALQTFEGYVITPLLYGKAVNIDPVTVLFGVLFFGLLWGPLGLAVAMPMMILLRGLVIISPDTPALDVLADSERPENAPPSEE